MAIISALFAWQSFEGNNSGRIEQGHKQTSSYKDRNNKKVRRYGNTQQSQGHVISCYRPYIIDGDTLTCDGTRIRLANIDAPEMPGHCKKWKKCTPGDPFASKNYLRSISSGSVICTPIEKDRYGRTVALCKAGDKDLSCAMVAAGHAIERYGVLNCHQ